jgi:hypothetical protein
MPRRSWLAKAKSIHDLGGHFYVPNPSRPWNDQRDALAERKWLAHFDKPLPVEEDDRPYFGSRLHDSHVLGIERVGGYLRLRLDSMNARNFARNLAAVLEVSRVETVYPVDLVLHDAAYVRAAREEIGGGLGYVDWERLGMGADETGVEFLYDWFFEQEGRLQWIAHLWVRHAHRTSRPNDVYLMVDCAKATADDRCPVAFAKQFGTPAALLYRDAVMGIDDRPIDFNVFDSSETENYIRRRIEAHGFRREDFF